MAAYDKTKSSMAFFEPSRAQDFMFISGTKVGDLIKTQTFKAAFYIPFSETIENQEKRLFVQDETDFRFLG